jgi:hypothetical protein
MCIDPANCTQNCIGITPSIPDIIASTVMPFAGLIYALIPLVIIIAIVGWILGNVHYGPQGPWRKL